MKLNRNLNHTDQLRIILGKMRILSAGLGEKLRKRTNISFLSYFHSFEGLLKNIAKKISKR